MDSARINHVLSDLRCFVFFGKRYKTPQGLPPAYWQILSTKFGNLQKEIGASDYHWYLVTFKDNRKELLCIKVRSGGMFTGMYPALYRGVIIPRLLRVGWYHHVRSIRVAF